MPDKKHIIVEDTLSKKILDKILQEVGLEEMLSVEFYPGGADNIKKYTIFTYAKTGISNRFILLDGDQRKETMQDLSRIPEVDKTIDYLMRLFKSVVGIDAKTITWGEDANRRDGRRNEDQVRALMIGYLQYFDSNVFFLPQQIPEDIIYDEERLKRYLGENDIPDVSQEGNSKKKLKRIADEVGVNIVDLENYLIYWFVKSKNTDYQEVLRLLKHIIEM